MAIYSRSESEYRMALRILGEDTRNLTTINQFMGKASKVNYFDIPMTFLGVHRFSCEKINDLIKTQIPSETTIIQFFKKIRSLDDVLTEKSKSSYVIFKEPQENLIRDDRLLEMRLKLEKKIYCRFM
jgi:hypothetical protein